MDYCNFSSPSSFNNIPVDYLQGLNMIPSSVLYLVTSTNIYDYLCKCPDAWIKELTSKGYDPLRKSPELIIRYLEATYWENIFIKRNRYTTISKIYCTFITVN